jgi:hypothetical protein
VKPFELNDEYVDVIFKALQARPSVAMCHDKRNQVMIDVPYIAIRREAFFMNTEFSIDELRASNNALWFYLLGIHNIEGIEQRVAMYIKRDVKLAEAKDSTGRLAINFATQSNVRAINSVLLVHGRFRILSLEHESATCQVLVALDEIDPTSPSPVALKVICPMISTKTDLLFLVRLIMSQPFLHRTRL